MLKLGSITITGCSFWNVFFPPRGGIWSKRLCRTYAYAYFLKNLSTLGTIASGALYVLGHLGHGTTVFHLLTRIFPTSFQLFVYFLNVFFHINLVWILKISMHKFSVKILFLYKCIFFSHNFTYFFDFKASGNIE